MRFVGMTALSGLAFMGVACSGSETASVESGDVAVAAAETAEETGAMSAEKSAGLINAVRENQQIEAMPAPAGGWAADTAYAINFDGLMGGEVPMSAFQDKAIHKPPAG